MTKFYGQRTCTLNIKEQLPNNYHDITHETIAELLHNEGILSETDTIQRHYLNVPQICLHVLHNERNIRRFL